MYSAALGPAAEDDDFDDTNNDYDDACHCH
jgi:hypothetical protein